MTSIISPSAPSVATASTTPKQVDRRSHRAKRDRCETGHDLLGRYADIDGHAREDLDTAPFAEEQLFNAAAPGAPGEVELTDPHGRVYRLEIVAGVRCSLQVRWCRHSPHAETAGLEVVSVRDVIAGMEQYEPARSLTVEAITCYRGERRVSVAALGLELERVDSSQLVLNRGLREAARDGLRISPREVELG